jgi:hypothetical protein
LLTWRSIATYHDLLAQFPSKKEYKELKVKWAGDEVGFRMALRGKLGPIFRINYYRIILDEAHAIKNHESSSKYRCLNSNIILTSFSHSCLLGTAGQVQVGSERHSSLQLNHGYVVGSNMDLKFAHNC